MKKTSLLQQTTRDATAPRLLSLSFAACLLSTALLLQAAMPPNPYVEIQFPEGPAGAGSVGVTTTNSGSLGGLAIFYQDLANPLETIAYPVFSTNVPVGAYVPVGNTFAVDLGGNFFSGSCNTPPGGNGGRAVDYSNPNDLSGFGTLGALPTLTICGWLNCQAYANYADGTRIAYAMQGPDGFELVQRPAGQLALSINEASDGTSPGTAVPLPLDGNAGTNNWVFFAATYDPTLPADQLKYYFGRSVKLAALDSAHTYVGGATFPDIQYSGPLAVGNVDSVHANRNATGGSCSRVFRGLIDELKIYTNALTLDEIQQAQLNGTVPSTPASFLKQPTAVTRSDGQDATFTAEANGSGLVTYQWRTNGVAVTGATNASFVWPAVRLANNGTKVTVLIDNAASADPGLVSEEVTLTVLPADPKIGWFPFSSVDGIFTPNAGSFGGAGRLKVVGGYPQLSSNVPTGQFAPPAAKNLGAIDMGLGTGNHRAVDITNNLVSPVGALGNMNALTICGWLNSGNHTFRTASTGRGCGIVNASLGDNNGGFVLGYRNNSLNATYGENGRLQFHVNEWKTDGITANLSSLDTIPLDTNLPAANWVFFAVTYDGTSSADNLKFYFGNGDRQATLDATQSYDKGPILKTGPLAIGNHNCTPGDPNNRMPGNPQGRNITSDNGTLWRGLLDEIKVFSKVLTLEEIQAEQVATPPALPPPPLQYMVETNHLVLYWEGTFQLQSRPDLGTGATWGDVTTPPIVSGTTSSVAVPLVGNPMFFRLRTP